MTQPNPKADSQSPAEGLRQRIRKELFWITRGTLEMASNIWLNSDTDEGISTTFGKLDAQYYHQQFGEDDGSYRTKESEDAIMELVSAYAATVEREGIEDSLKLWKGWLAYVESGGGHINRTQIKDMIAELEERLAALQGPQDGDE